MLDPIELPVLLAQSPPLLPSLPERGHSEQMEPWNGQQPLSVPQRARSEVAYLHPDLPPEEEHPPNHNYEELILSEDSLSENSYCFSDQQLVRLGIDSDFFSKIP